MAEFLCTAVISPPYPLVPEQIARAKAIAARAINGSDGPQEGNEPDKPKEPDGSLKCDGLEADSDRSVTCNFESGFPCGRINSGGLGIEGSIRSSEGAEEKERERDDIVFQMLDLDAGFWKGLSTTSMANDHDNIFMFGNPANTDMSAHTCEVLESRDADGAQPSDHASSAVAGAGPEEGETIVDFQENKWRQGSGTGTNLAVAPSATQALPSIVGPLRSGLSRGIIEEGRGGERRGNLEDVKLLGLDSGPGPPHAFIGDDKNSIIKTMANASADFVKPDSNIQTDSRQSHDSSNCIVPATTDTTEISRTATTLAAPAAHVNINGTDVVDPARRSRSNAKEEASTENAHQSTDADYSDKNHEGAATFVTSSTLFADAVNASDASIASSSAGSSDLLSFPTKSGLNNILVPSRRLPAAFLHSSSGREQLLSGSSGTTTSARTGAVPLQSQKHTHLQKLQLQLPSDSRNQQRQKGPQSLAETLPEIITTTASAIGSSFSERIEHLQNHVAASAVADHQQPPTQATQSFRPTYQPPLHGNLASDCPSCTSESSLSPSQTISSLIPPPDIPPRSSSRLRTQSIGRPSLRHRITSNSHHRSASAGSSSSNTGSATTARLEDSTNLTKTVVPSCGGPLNTQAAQGAEQQVYIGPGVQSQLESQESSHIQQQYYSHSPQESEVDTARLDHKFYFQQLSTATSTKASSRTFGFSFGSKSRSRSNSATTESPSAVVDAASGSGFEVLSTETRGRPQTQPAPGISAKDRETLEQESRNITLENPLPVSTSVRATSSHIPSSSGSFFSQLTASRDRLLPASWHRDRDHSRAREHPRERLDEPTGLVPFYFSNNHEPQANEPLQGPILLPSPLLKGDQILTSHKPRGKALSRRLHSESSTALPSPTRSGFPGSSRVPVRTGRSVSLTSAQPKLAPGSSSGHAPSLSLSVKPAPQGAVPPLPPLLLGNFGGFPATSAALSGVTAPLVISPPISPSPTATSHNNHARSKSRSKSKFDKSKSNPASPRSPSSSTFSFHLHSPPHHPNTPKKRNLWLPSRGRPSLEVSLSPTLLSTPNRGINVSPRRQTFSLEHTSRHTQITSSSDMDTPKLSGKLSSAFGPRPDASTLSVASKTSTMSSQNSASTSSDALLSKPFVLKNGRTFINDSTLPYPLPVDLTELHRESLRTLFLIQLFRVPVCCPLLSTKPPTKVLEVGCGSGFWSMMCHRYFRNRGHPGISFTGLDISPLAPSSTSGLRRPDQDMKWRFVQHDLRVTPLPFPNGEFDLIMVKDMSLAVTNGNSQRLMDEYIRLLTPGGVLEIWESDHTIRMLRPQNGTPEDDGEKEPAIALGAYVMTPNTPLSSALNRYIVEYNAWITKFLDSKDLSAVPCTFIGPNLLQESEALCDVKSRRLAVPLSDVRWEKEGIGGVLATGKSSKRRSKPPGLSPGQLALRQTALLTVVQKIQGLEDALRKVSGKSQDEWDTWMGRMMKDLLQDNGTSWGECLEIGAWWATKRE